MDNAETALPKRKHARLKHYDYSTTGAYFVTICTKNKRPMLSAIVGRGLAPAVELTPLGKIAEEQIFLLEERFPFIIIDDYVIMPNHIHAIIILKNQAAGASPRPTLTDIICAYKSLTTRECKKVATAELELFQTSFYEHVIRNKHDHDAIVKYIYENPMNWAYDKHYQDI